MKNNLFKDWDAIEATKTAIALTTKDHSKAIEFVNSLISLGNNQALSSYGIKESTQHIYKSNNEIIVFTNYRYIHISIHDNKHQQDLKTNITSYLLWKDLLQLEIDSKESPTVAVRLKFKDLVRVVNLKFLTSDIAEIQKFLSLTQLRNSFSNNQ